MKCKWHVKFASGGFIRARAWAQYSFAMAFFLNCYLVFYDGQRDSTLCPKRLAHERAHRSATATKELPSLGSESEQKSHSISHNRRQMFYPFCFRLYLAARELPCTRSPANVLHFKYNYSKNQSSTTNGYLSSKPIIRIHFYRIIARYHEQNFTQNK